MKKNGFFLLCFALLFWLFTQMCPEFLTPNYCAISSSKTHSKKCLAKYFSDLFHRGGFGYTLIGARALAFDIPEQPTPFRTKKQKIIFNSKKFLFKENRIESSFRVATFIHKDNFIKTFNENKDLFEKVLGEHVTAKSLLHEIETSERHILDIIHYDEALLGVLLGHGRENAQLYARWVQITSFKTNPLQPHPVIPYFHWNLPPKFSLEVLTPAPGFATLNDERKWFREYFATGSCKREHFTPFDIIYPRGFRVKKSPETNQLIKKYKKCKELLTNLFYGRDCVDVVLEQLTSDTPLSIE